MTDINARKFLCVVDDTPECKIAVRFAARRAQRTGGHVALLYVIEPGDFGHWMAVEERMREEAQDEAEHALYESASIVNEVSGDRPEVIIREGKPREQIAALLGEDASISILVLGASTAKEGPGPLVSAIIGSEVGRGFPLPVTIVPGNLTSAEIDALS